MKHSKRETFFWLEGAALLDKTHILAQCLKQLDQNGRKKIWAAKMPNELKAKLYELATSKEYAQEISRAATANPKKIRDYCKVRESLDLGTRILVCLARHQVSIDELASGANETSKMRIGTLRVDMKKYALAYVGATGNTADRVVAYALRSGTITTADVLRAKRKRKRRPLFEPARISIVARFLIDNWCGNKGVYGMWKNWFDSPDKNLSETVGVARATNGGYECKKSPSFFVIPPLCFFSNKALASFCALALRKKQNDPDTSEPAVRKWVSRLELKHAVCPKIRELKIVGDEIHFRR